MGSHRTRATRERRRPGVHAQPVGPRHAARPQPPGGAHATTGAATRTARATHAPRAPHAPQASQIQPSAHVSHARLTPAQARRRAAVRERMLQRRRRSLGALSMLVLAVTVVITLTRPGPQEAVAASRDVSSTVPSSVYSANAATTLPPGAAADQAAAALLSVPVTPVVTVAAKPATWTKPAGATIRCPVTVTACVDLKAKITWLQHGSTIFLGPVRMQPGEGSKKTPRGTFTINRKAAVYFSHTYGGAMPYSVFWGHDGIAFHEGTLTGFSHGCIHLSMADAKKFFAALSKGERVYVA